MAKSKMIFLLSIFALSLSSCGLSIFKMIDHGDHGQEIDVKLEISNQEKAMAFLENVETTLEAIEVEQYKEYGSDIYSNSYVKTNQGEYESEMVSISKGNIELRSEIVKNKNAREVKHHLYNDASEENKVKVYLNTYVMMNDKLKMEPYYTEESKGSAKTNYLDKYYVSARTTYLENLTSLASSFAVVALLADLTLKNPESGTVNFASLKVNYQYKDKSMVTYDGFQIQVDTDDNLTVAKLVLDSQGFPKIVSLETNDHIENKITKATLSLLPYNKTIRPFEDEPRKVIKAEQLDKMIYSDIKSI